MASRLAATAAILAVLAGACTGSTKKPSASGQGSSASTPTASASISPSTTPSNQTSHAPWSEPFVVRISSDGPDYTLEMIDASGHVKLKRRVRDPVRAFSGKAIPNQGQGVPTMPFALSSTRLYFLDNFFSLGSIDEHGHFTPLFFLARPGKRRIGFAVSPDDRKIAVGIVDYSGIRSDGTGTIKNTIFVTDLPYPRRRVNVLYEQSVTVPSQHQAKVYVEWPLAWFGSNLIVNVAPVQNYASGYTGDRGRATDLETIHVADAVTGHRTSLLCPGGIVMGPITVAGSVCRLDNTTTAGSGVRNTVILWNGTVRPLGSQSGQGCVYQAGPLSPDGSIAAVNGFSTTSKGCFTSDEILLVDANASIMSAGVQGIPLGWLDPTHLIYSPGTFHATSGPPRILDTQSHSQTAIDGGAGAFAAITFGLA